MKFKTRDLSTAQRVLKIRKLKVGLTGRPDAQLVLNEIDLDMIEAGAQPRDVALAVRRGLAETLVGLLTFDRRETHGDGECPTVGSWPLSCDRERHPRGFTNHQLCCDLLGGGDGHID